MNSQKKHYFYCVSDLNNSTIYPRPLAYFNEAKEICEKENSSLITSLEPNFDFQREISRDVYLTVIGNDYMNFHTLRTPYSP